MIEWIAPNYLGPAAEFRCKYVDPIEAGLYIDSTANERRKSLKMLRVLNEDLSPKVNRADMSVLRDDLPKKEFVITVTLTELQKQAYSVYVRSMIPGAKKDIKQTTIWHWISILTLIVNHPSCFMAKLRERKEVRTFLEPKCLSHDSIMYSFSMISLMLLKLRINCSLSLFSCSVDAKSDIYRMPKRSHRD